MQHSEMVTGTTVAPSWSELFDLRGRVAVVTGAAMGIGEAIARRLAVQGAAVIVADVDDVRGPAVARSLEPARGGADFVRTDVRGVADTARLVRETVQRFGRLDILVNNAGVFPFSPALEVGPELWDRVLGINLRGAFFLTQAAAREMRNEGHAGSILNIASVDALHPSGQLAPYDASKGGLRMATRSLALELAPLGIRVNAVAPGGIATPGAAAAMALPAADAARLSEQFLARIPAHRMGEPDDIARAALFLVSPAASYITGVTLVVDGGYLLT